jgi:hypothetical protein
MTQLPHSIRPEPASPHPYFDIGHYMCFPSETPALAGPFTIIDNHVPNGGGETWTYDLRHDNGDIRRFVNEQTLASMAATKGARVEEEADHELTKV